MAISTADRYTIISSDCHAGASHQQYREYLDPAYLEQFDAWRGRYKNPFRDLKDDTRTRNWDDARRLAEEEADGVVAEVLFPNTVPPFFPTGAIIAPAPSAADFELRLAGLRAHNRWLADFCAALPGRRAGLAQIFLNDLDEAERDVLWAKEHGLAGILLPGVAPDTDIDPLFSPVYDRLWALCQDLDLPVTHHGGGTGMPDLGKYPWSNMIYTLEAGFFSNRVLWHLIMSGVFERFPRLVFVMTEQGSAWIPEALERMDGQHDMIRRGGLGELGRVAPEAILPQRPSDYFRQNCFVGASFPSPGDAQTFEQIGLDRVMWGSDYPHREGTYPYTRESLRRSFSHWDSDRLRAVLSGNAARIYGFDLDKLAPVAAKHGPAVDEVAQPLETIPEEATSPAFFRR